LCEGIGPFAQKPCTVQCAKSGPEPVADIKLMPCQSTACNKCSQKCGGGQYSSNPGTVGNWQFSPTYTTGATWSKVGAPARLPRAAASHYLRSHARVPPPRL
jgi:hypothetical protein